MRIMHDGVNPNSIPPADMFLGYDDGLYADVAAIQARYPGAKVLKCTVFANDDEGDVGDCEQWDMTPDTLVDWVVRRRNSGHPNPIGYCSAFQWTGVRSRFTGRGVQEPSYILADYFTNPPSSPPTIPKVWLDAGVVGWQYFDYGGYDASVMVDFIPGIDDPTPGGSMAVFGADGAALMDAVLDERRAIIRKWWWDLYHTELTLSAQFVAMKTWGEKGGDLTLAAILDGTIK